MRILWLKTELLHPVDKGGKIRTYQMLKELKKQHHITYLTLDDGTADTDAYEKSKEYAHDVVAVSHRNATKFSSRFYSELAFNLVSDLPYALQKYVSSEMSAKIEELTVSKSFDILICDFLTPAINLPDKLELPTLLFQHNVEAMIWQRHFEVATNPIKKAFLKKQWKRMLQFEKATCRAFDSVVTVSEQDAETIRTEYGIDKVSSIPTGVDVEYFTPRRDVEKDPCNLVFTGSMDWLPNEDAIRWFVEEVMPLIRDRVPTVSLTVVGRNPSRDIVKLSRSDASIRVVGRVEDVRPFMEMASTYIVPIRIGGGTRLKIYEAMAMELPVVSTTVGAEGLPVLDGEEILLRDSSQDFADAVKNMILDSKGYDEMARNAAKRVRNDFGWRSIADEFGRICERIVDGK